MFDVRPLNESGDLDLIKIKSLKKIIEIKNKSSDVRKNLSRSHSPQMRRLGDIFKPAKVIKSNDKPRWYKEYFNEANKNREIKIKSDDCENVREIGVKFKGNDFGAENYWQENRQFAVRDSFSEYSRKKLKFDDNFKVAVDYRISFSQLFSKFSVGKYFWTFSKIAAAVVLGIVIFRFAQNGLKLKNQGLAESQTALAEMASAKDNLKNLNFQESAIQFKNANERLTEVSKELDGMGGVLMDFTKYVPYLSQLSSGKHLISAGNDLSQVGVLVAGLLQTAENIKTSTGQGESISYLKIFQDNIDNLKKAQSLLSDAQSNLDEVNLDDVPKDKSDQIAQLKNELPQINSLLTGFLGEENVWIDILGGNGPRKYLFLFQNNQEMRPTGGFIGSYGILNISNGRVENFKIDGIFDPDGQLKTLIVPPGPIQKISANWSLHDSNWFPDFPESAEKAIWFYEKTGGPTVDGVIAMTPTVMQKLLELTGPIDMPEYGVVVDKDNFIESIQYEVEVDYDKELNQPKKILSDLAPKILDKIFNLGNPADLMKALNVLTESLNEKHILIYSRNWQVEKLLSDNNWSGEILNTPKDYLSVINTNINGFKTDGVVDEQINHQAEVQSDGSVIDTVSITRRHNGGDAAYEWWNKVNADYMRVYVPKGSRLLNVSGQTREFDSPPLDYKALGYQADPQLELEKQTEQIDQDSGTRIYEDHEKTVFANWVYVSPKESATITYTYVLPFKIQLSDKATGTYSILAQKQSGSRGSKFESTIAYPSNWNALWKYPQNNLIEPNNLPASEKGIKMETDLATDKFLGLAFSK